VSTKSRLLNVRDRFGVTCWNIGDTRRPPAGGRLAPHPHEARPRAAAPLALTVDQIRQETQLLLRCLVVGVVIGFSILKDPLPSHATEGSSF